MNNRSSQLMWHQLINLDSNGQQSLQMQLRTEMTRAILDGRVSLDVALPSNRDLAKQLSVSRNTVVLAYQKLIDDGYLINKERQGYFVNPSIVESTPIAAPLRATSSDVAAPDWSRKIRIDLANQRNIKKPGNWSSFEYPFVYGQSDPSLFPIADWRECLRESHSHYLIGEESFDYVDQDDSVLVEELCSRVLPRRGIWTTPDNILITMGTQNALFLTAHLLLDRDSKITLENPGYPDIRNLIQLQTQNIHLQDVDYSGMLVDNTLNDSDVVYVTPSHQSPTMATMPLDRREDLLQLAVENDFVVIEDDYEPESNYVREPLPALKSIDSSDRVIYCGSFSKSLAPGLRLGYLVANEQFIKQARMLRRLHLRHPPPLMQRTVALFLQLGHYDSHVRRLHQVYRQRWEIMGEALERYLPGSTEIPEFGGSAYWICGPQSLDSRKLAASCAQLGILIEPGDVHFGQVDPPLNFFRLGLTSIKNDKIDTGIRKISECLASLIN